MAQGKIYLRPDPILPFLGQFQQISAAVLSDLKVPGSLGAGVCSVVEPVFSTRAALGLSPSTKEQADESSVIR